MQADSGSRRGHMMVLCLQDVSLASPASRCLASVGVAAFRAFSYSAATCDSNWTHTEHIIMVMKLPDVQRACAFPIHE